MKATAKAPANIAFIKYWGRKDKDSRIPANASVSMNLSACTTMTTVEFSKGLESDRIVMLDGGRFDEKETARIVTHLDRIRNKAGISEYARVATRNTFPKSTGIASSASGFAALTVAAAAASGMSLPAQELAALARLGSGSACRSVPDGFVKWEGEQAYSLYPSSYWDLRDVLVVVGSTGKDVTSTAGHDTAGTSPFFSKRLVAVPGRISRLESAFQTKDFAALGAVIEEDCLDMHHVMQTQVPPLLYWTRETKAIMGAVAAWREEGIPVYFTIDAGPNVHLICEGNTERTILDKLNGIPGIQAIIRNAPSDGTMLIQTHLF